MISESLLAELQVILLEEFGLELKGRELSHMGLSLKNLFKLLNTTTAEEEEEILILNENKNEPEHV